MQVFRIAKKKYIRDLSGTGAKLYGGRWNPKGYAVLYTSENRALAVLEVLVHLTPQTIPDDMEILTLEVPDEEIERYGPKKYSRMLEQPDHGRLFQEEGKAWLKTGKSMALRVPSVLIPGEHNILINPEHEAIRKVKIISTEPFTFDKRLLIR